MCDFCSLLFLISNDHVRLQVVPESEALALTRRNDPGVECASLGGANDEIGDNGKGAAESASGRSSTPAVAATTTMGAAERAAAARIKEGFRILEGRGACDETSDEDSNDDSNDSASENGSQDGEAGAIVSDKDSDSEDDEGAEASDTFQVAPLEAFLPAVANGGTPATSATTAAAVPYNEVRATTPMVGTSSSSSSSSHHHGRRRPSRPAMGSGPIGARPRGRAEVFSGATKLVRGAERPQRPTSREPAAPCTNPSVGE
jgi:hypothetical protein